MFRLTLLLILLFAGITAPPSVAANDSPHVLFIAIDDLNDWLGCLNGHPQALSPNIDRLAARGILFTNAHCVAPACRPSRAALLSGQTPQRTGVWSNRSPSLLGQHPDLPALPRVFQRAGYATRGTGKLIHQGGAGELLFERFFRPEQRWSPLTRESVRYTADELPSKGTTNPRHLVERPGQEPIVLPLNRLPSARKPDNPDGESFDWGPFDVADEAMGDAQITDWAVNYLNDSPERPLFLGVGYYRPHIPLWAPRSWFDRFRGVEIQLPPYNSSDLDDLSDVARQWAVQPVTAGLHSTVEQHGEWRNAVRAYLACVTFVDHQVGRLLDALDSGPLGNNTLIVLWSDHGWHLGEKQHWGKWTGWERSTRVPLIIVPPRRQSERFAAGGTSCHEPVSLLDLFPTITEICRVTAPESLDGRSLVPLLKSPQQQTDRAAITWFDRGNVTVRTRRWRYLRYADGSEELYDHEADPNEWTNLVGNGAPQAVLTDLRNRASAASLPR